MGVTEGFNPSLEGGLGRVTPMLIVNMIFHPPPSAPPPREEGVISKIKILSTSSGVDILHF